MVGVVAFGPGNQIRVQILAGLLSGIIIEH